MRKMAIWLTILALCGCTARQIDTAKLCQQWVLDGSDIPCTTEFRHDGTVYVDYENGTDLEGTWQPSTNGTIVVAIRDWRLSGRLEGAKLIVRNGENVKTYSVKQD